MKEENENLENEEVLQNGMEGQEIEEVEVISDDEMRELTETEEGDLTGGASKKNGWSIFRVIVPDGISLTGEVKLLIVKNPGGYRVRIMGYPDVNTVEIGIDNRVFVRGVQCKLDKVYPVQFRLTFFNYKSNRRDFIEFITNNDGTCSLVKN